MKLKNIFNLSSRNFIVDPFKTIVKLGILVYMPEGTKIGFNENELVFYDPSIYQGITRFVNGDTRTDVHNLLHPIYFACKWYSENINMRNIFLKSIEGINKLKYLYKDEPIILQCLDYYIVIIETHMKTNNDNEIDIIYNNNYTPFKNYWTIRDISIVSTLFDYINELTEKEKIMYVYQSIEEFLKIN
jgi:hypothetical protein